MGEKEFPDYYKVRAIVLKEMAYLGVHFYSEREDIIHEIYLDLLEHPKKFIRHAIVDYLRKWLGRPSERGFVNERKKNLLLYAKSIDSVVQQPVYDYVEDKILIKQVLRGLPDRLLYVFNRHYFMGEDFKTIGRAMGVGESRVCQLYEKACAMLRKRVSRS